MFKQIVFARLIVAAALFGAAAVQALVAPNPASLLSTKKLLIIYGTEATTGDHGAARVALNNKLNQIRGQVGFTRDSINGSANPTGISNLDQYDIIVFCYWFHSSVSQQSSFQTFANNFKAWTKTTNKKRGWLGMHTSGANEVNEWNWFRDSVTAMGYRAHSSAPTPPGTIRRTLDPDILSHPIMAALPDTFRVPADEWYDFAYVPNWSQARVMYNLDESTLGVPLGPDHTMNPHPMAWFREEPSTQNRFFYTALVHNASGVNSSAGNDFFASMMLRALEYLAGYQTTSIKLNGQGQYHNNERVKGVYHFRRGEELKVESEGAYRLQVLDMRGRVLFRANGRGAAVHRPEAFNKSGMYVVKVSGKSGSYVQRVMVQ